MWPNPQFHADWVFTEEIFNGKLHFLWSGKNRKTTVVLEYIRLDIIMTVIICYLE